MSEEEVIEKEAIEYLKDFRNNVYNGVGSGSVMAKNIDIIFAIIDKQQKEIEDLKAITRTYEAYNVKEDEKIIVASKEYFINGFFKDFLSDYVSEDKIREKIEEITSYAYTSAAERDCQDYAIQVLKELLGE